MNILKLFSGREKSESKREPYEEEILQMLDFECARRHEERAGLELEWMLCSNYYSGHQYCDINSYHGEIEDITPPYDYMERGIYNRISSLIETRISHFKELHFGVRVKPRSSEADDYEKSLVATRLLSYAKNKNDFDRKIDNMILWSELCGSAFMLSWWDTDGGRVLGEVAGEKGNVKQIREGDLSCGLLSPYEILPETIYKENISDQRSLIIEQVMSTDDIFDAYGVRVAGGEIDTYALTPTAGGGGFGYLSSTFALSYRKAANSAYVRIYMERRGKEHPEGRLIISAADKLIFSGALPYDDFPLVAMKCKNRAGMFFGRSVISELIPLQRAYNGVKNKIHDYIRTAAANPLLIPEGCVDDIDGLSERGCAPGDIIEYNPDRGAPSPLAITPLPAGIADECENIAREMEYVAGLSQLSAAANTPSGVTGAAAIEKLKQIDNTRLALTGDNIRMCAREIAKTWLSIYKRYASVYRTAQVVGTNDIGSTLVWCADDINSLDIELECENELLTTAQAQRDALIKAVNLGLFSDENGRIKKSVKRKIIERLGLDLSCGSQTDELQYSAAARENIFMTGGRDISVGLYDDHEIHIDAHKNFALQYSFEKFRRERPSLAEKFDAHITRHEELMKEKERTEKNAGE